MSTPIYFYYPNEVPNTLDYKSGLDCWILKTFWILKKKESNINIHLVNYIPELGIIIFHKGFISKEIIPSKNQLFVCIQADYGRYKYAQCHILQNPAGLNNFKFSKKSFFEEALFSFSKNSFIPHWNQDNIIPRLNSRGNKFENVSFFGVVQNFPKELLNKNFSDKLLNHGINFNLITNSYLWNDYSETDCVLAIRDFEKKSHFNKPSSKVINGYLAGVPVISGNESSALHLKSATKINLPIVQSSDECFNEIIKLKNQFYSRIVEVGDDNKKLHYYHDEKIILAWKKQLDELEQKFVKWQKSSKIIQKIFFQFCRI